MGYPVKQSSTARPLFFLMVDSTDHLTGKTGLSPTVTLSKNGAAFAAPAGAVTELAHGWYRVAGNATDNNTLGVLLLHATGTAADPTDEVFEVVVYDPADAVRLGLTALPNANAGANGGLPTGNASGQVSLNMTQTVTDVGSTMNTLGGIVSGLRAYMNGKLTIVSGVLKFFGQDNTTQIGIDRTVTGTVPGDTTRQ